MENKTTTIEQSIKNRIERVAPSRALFEATLLDVTKAKSERFTTMKAVPSPYQNFVSRVTSRGAKVGVSVALVALIAVLALKTGGYSPLQHIQESLTGVTPTTFSAPQNEDVSTDNIVAMLMDDADAELTLGTAEDVEGTALTQDLEDYTII